MPNLGPGVPNNVVATPAPLLVFTPTPGAAASCRFVNLGSSTAYIGGPGVSPGNGLPLAPGNRPVDLQTANVNLYACSGVSGVIATTTLTAAAVAAGATSFTVAAAVTAGTYLRVGNSTGVEYVLASSVASNTVVTTGTPIVYDHAASATVATVTPAATPLTISAGVL